MIEKDLFENFVVVNNYDCEGENEFKCNKKKIVINISGRFFCLIRIIVYF